MFHSGVKRALDLIDFREREIFCERNIVTILNRERILGLVDFIECSSICRPGIYERDVVSVAAA